MNLHAAASVGHVTSVYRDVPMRLAEKCLRENANNIKAKAWDFPGWSLKLEFAQPVRVGEWDNIAHVTLSYRMMLRPPQMPANDGAVVVDLTHEAD